jgi:hypothetical protein
MRALTARFEKGVWCFRAQVEADLHGCTMQVHLLQRTEVNEERVLRLRDQLGAARHCVWTGRLSWRDAISCNFPGSLLLTEQERAPMRAGNCTIALLHSPVSTALQKTAASSRPVQPRFANRSTFPRSRDCQFGAYCCRHVTKHSWRCLKPLGRPVSQFQLHMHGDVTRPDSVSISPHFSPGRGGVRFSQMYKACCASGLK